MLAPKPREQRRFQLVLIKPSHYDADGYVIQWARSSIPSNSLACVYALAMDAAERDVLGIDIDIDISAMDETNTRVRINDIVAQFRAHDNFGMVGLVGVQSNQFPRALDIARPLRAAGIAVAIGGFHVSGCIAMLTETQADLKAALDMGCSLFAGEAEEGRLDTVLRDAAAGRAQADLQLHGRSAGARGDADAVPAAAQPPAHRQPLRQFRCRPRLSVPVLVLHHHQRAGPQVAPPHAGRHRAAAAPAHPVRLPLVLHHRRQFRPQQGLGADLRPHHRVARARRPEHQDDHPGRHACATRSRTSSTRRRAPACARCSSGWRTSIRRT